MFFPKLEHGRTETHLGDVSLGSTDCYKILTTPGGANTKSAWTELLAATAFDTDYLVLDCQVSGNAFFYLDIGIGPAGSEVVVVPNLVITRNRSGGSNADLTVAIPLAIPKGTRLAVRFQHHSGGSNLFRVKAHLFSAGFAGLRSPGVYEGWGQDTTLTYGKQVTTGAANTKGSWVQLVAATAFDTRWLFTSIQSLESPRHVWWDLGVGAAGSEVVFLANMNFTNEQNGDLYGPFPLVIPKGSRVAVRAGANNAGSIPQIAAWGGGR